MLVSYHGQPTRLCDHCNKVVSNLETSLYSYDKRGESLDYCSKICLDKHGVVHPPEPKSETDEWHTDINRLSADFMSWAM